MIPKSENRFFGQDHAQNESRLCEAVTLFSATSRGTRSAKWLLSGTNPPGFPPMMPDGFPADAGTHWFNSGCRMPIDAVGHPPYGPPPLSAFPNSGDACSGKTMQNVSARFGLARQPSSPQVFNLQ
jgi:hypothetical protein